MIPARPVIQHAQLVNLQLILIVLHAKLTIFFITQNVYHHAQTDIMETLQMDIVKYVMGDVAHAPIKAMTPA